MNNEVIFPSPLKKGDKIAICSPAGPVDPDIVERALPVLRDCGWQPIVMPNALGKFGHFSGTDDQRFADMKAAILDPEIKAIICSRGGYGVVHNLDRLARLPLRENAKWIVGFSDISALHALMAANGIASIHSSMCAAIKRGDSDPDNAALFDILKGGRPAHVFDGHPYDNYGIVTGKLVGGNLAVIAELINTPYDIIQPDTILFIEDVAEPIYKIERILYQLRLSGVLHRLKGLIIGQFTDCRPDDNYATMEDMIRAATSDCKFPIAFGVPVGHVDHNIPLIESAVITLKVSPSGRNSIIFHRS